jgi:hypothetical protein
MTVPRPVLALLAAIGFASGCSPAPQGPWQKPGADEPTSARDTANCRTEAQAEALRRYPYGAASAGFDATGAVSGQQRDSANRATVEAARFNACMTARGYSRT